MLGVSKAVKLNYAIQNIVTTHVARTARRSGGISVADLGVHGNAAFTHAFALVGSLRSNCVMLEKW
jgi:hypothetical protein